MTTSTPPDNTVLVLSPPMVNGQTTPVTGAHIGVPLVAYDLVTDGEGAVVLVDPPLAGTMDPGDVMELWLENEPAALDSETIEDPDVRTTLRIPKGRLHPDRVNKLFYTVRRGSANRGTSTPPLEILYNRIRPGLKDRLTDPGGHSELNLLLPDAIKNGVGPDFVSAEVCVAYPYCRAYDVITLKCNGELLEPKPKVNPNQAPQPPNPGSEDPITICFTITRAYLDQAKRLDKKLHFSYTVTDQIGNGPDTDAPWSPVQSVDEDLDGTRLKMPILLERKEDYPGDEAETIELEKLAGNPLLLVVLTKDNRFAVGDEIVATYTTTGQTEPVVVRGKVEEDPFLGKLPCFLEVPNDKVFADSKVTAIYEVHRPGVGLVGSSNTATATVVGSRIVLKPPKIKEAPNDTSLDPLDAQNTLTGLIDYDGMLVSDKISVRWIGAPGTLPGGSHTTAPWPVTRVGPQEIPLAVSVIAFNLDKSITLDYSVTRGSQEPKDSETRTLAVLPIAQSHLPKPLITQASEAGEGSELDVSQLTTNATLRANSYPHIALRQYVWLKAKGTLKGGGVYSKTFWQPPGSQTNATWINHGFYTHAFPLADLQSLEDGSDLELEFKAGFGGTQVESEAVTFALRNYKIKALDLEEPSIKEANDKSLDPFAAKDKLTAVIPAYKNMIGTQVTVTWSGTPGEGSATAGPVDVTVQAEKEVELPNSVVAFNLGKPVKVTYTVIRHGASQNSDELALTVLSIADGDKNLPKPAIDGAVGNDLDITELEETAQLRIEKWLLQASNQCIWLRYDGTDKNGNAVDKVFWAGEAHQQTSGLVTAAQVAWLRELKDGLPLNISFKVNFDKVVDPDTAVDFPITIYTVKAVSDFIVDTSPVNLSGRNFTVDLETIRWALTGADPSGTAVCRSAAGGVPPYSYISSNTAVASVDETGMIRSEGNGTATITVSDASGQSRSISVTASNVREIISSNTLMSHAQSLAWVRSVNGTSCPDRLNDMDLLERINIKYKALPPGVFWNSGYYRPRYFNPGYPSPQGGYEFLSAFQNADGTGPMSPMRFSPGNATSAVHGTPMCFRR